MVEFRSGLVLLLAVFVTGQHLMLANGNFIKNESLSVMRPKRQVPDRGQQANNQRPSVQGSAMATSMAGYNSPETLASTEIGGASGQNPSLNSAKVRPQMNSNAPSMVDNQDPPSGPTKPMRNRRPPMRNRKPPPTRYDSYDDHDNDQDQDGDCDYNEFDYGNPFHAAMRPMQQMSNMMGNMFDQMQSLASGDFRNLPNGNYAVASASSDDDGYSKVSSIVNNNGRRRGIISETRNGRTQTRRIGDDDDGGQED